MSEYIFKLPDLGEGTVESEIAEWMVKVGDTVREEDAICAMLTDKAAVELSSPVSGRVVKLAGEVGDTIAVGTPLITFELAAGAETSAPEKPRTGQEKTVSAAATTGNGAQATNDRARTSPSIRQRAREAGVDLGHVRGSGPGGRILASDFEAFLARPPADSAQSGPAVATTPARDARTGTTEHKVLGLRRKIAQRMEQANQEVPHFAYVEEVDVTALEELRQHLNSQRPGGTEMLSFLPFIALALVRVLREFPQCNAHYDKERNVLIHHHAVHLGIATQTSDGLKVPVVRHAESRSLDELALEIHRLAKAARDNTTSRDELSGSTITLTSLGKLGGVVSTPIINLPEVAIVGVNRAVARPAVHQGQVAIRLLMNLSSSFDHRFVDGYDGAAMIQALKQMLEQPAMIFI